MNNGLAVSVHSSQINIKFLHKCLQRFDIPKSAYVVHQLGTLLLVNDVSVCWELPSKSH